MRLISQDGKTDIPYENSAVYVQAIYYYNKEKKCHDTTGYKLKTPIGDDIWVLGEYSTEEKALKVMKEIREAYKECLIENSADPYYYMPQDNEVTEKSV